MGLLRFFQKSISLKKMLSSGSLMFSIPPEDILEIIWFRNPYSGGEEPDYFLG